MADHVLADTGLADFDAELEEFAVNARSASECLTVSLYERNPLGNCRIAGLGSSPAVAVFLFPFYRFAASDRPAAVKGAPGAA